MKSDLTVCRLREVVSYDKDTGIFTNQKTGLPLARPHNAGYLTVFVGGKKHLAHRLAWLYVHGVWPNVIDHIDGLRTNNALSNLRNVTKLINQQNIKVARVNNACGYLGASFDRQTGRWMSQIRADGKKIHLGRFDTPEEAHAVYITAKRELHQGNTL